MGRSNTVLLFIGLLAYCVTSVSSSDCSEEDVLKFRECMVDILPQTTEGDFPIFANANRTIATNICGSYFAKFQCIERVTHSCNEVADAVKSLGINIKNLKHAVGSICGDIETFKSGIPCYNTAKKEMHDCRKKSSQAAQKPSKTKMSQNDAKNHICRVSYQAIQCMRGVLMRHCYLEEQADAIYRYELIMLPESCKRHLKIDVDALYGQQTKKTSSAASYHRGLRPFFCLILFLQIWC